MDLISFSTSFAGLFGMSVFFLLITLFFIIEGLISIKNPISLAFIALFLTALFLGKMTIVSIFLIWTFELIVIFLSYNFLIKNPEKNSDWFWFGLALIAFVWVF